MLVVDSSVWIDHFNGVDSGPGRALSALLEHGDVELLIPDLVLFEVMRGFRYERDQRLARQAMAAYPTVGIGGEDNVMRAAAHYRQLRSWGRTVRSSVDMLVASWCISQDHLLLQRDRDFEPYAKHFGLRLWALAH